MHNVSCIFYHFVLVAIIHFSYSIGQMVLEFDMHNGQLDTTSSVLALSVVCILQDWQSSFNFIQGLISIFIDSKIFYRYFEKFIQTPKPHSQRLLNTGESFYGWIFIFTSNSDSEQGSEQGSILNSIRFIMAQPHRVLWCPHSTNFLETEESCLVNSDNEQN